jgi:hypothetical protein
MERHHDAALGPLRSIRISADSVLRGHPVLAPIMPMSEHTPGANLVWSRERPVILKRSGTAAWFRRMSPLMQAVVVIVSVATLAAVVAVGGLVAFFAWDEHQFRNGSYCHAEPDDPLC